MRVCGRSGSRNRVWFAAGFFCLLSLVACGGGGGNISAGELLRVTFPPPFAEIESTSVVVLGETTEPWVVSSILVNGIEAVTADGFRTWSAPVPLVPGQNPVRIDIRGQLGTLLTSTALPPVERQGGYSIGVPSGSWVAVRPQFDPLRRRLLVYSAMGDIVAVDVDTGFRRSVWSSTTGAGPLPSMIRERGVAYDAARDVFYALEPQSTQFRILAIELATGNRTPIVAPTTIRPRSLVFDTVRDRLLFVDEDHAVGHRIFAVDPTTYVASELSGPNVGAGPGLVSFGFIGSSFAEFPASATLVVDPVRDRLVLFTGSAALGTSFPGRILSIDPVSGDRTVAYPPGLTNAYLGVAFDPTGSRFLIHRLDPASTITNPRTSLVAYDLDVANATVLATNLFSDNYPSLGLPLDPASGKVYFRDRHGVTSFDLDDGARSVVSSWDPALLWPQDVAFDPVKGIVFAADALSTGGIHGFDVTTGERVFSTAAYAERLAWDRGGTRLILRQYGVLEALDPVGDALQVLSSDSTLVGSGPPLSYPYAIAVSDSGEDVFAVAHETNSTHQLLRVDPVTGNRTTVVAGLPIVSSMVLDRDTGLLILRTNDSLLELDPRTASLRTISGGSVGGGPPLPVTPGAGPIAVDAATGDIVYCVRTENRIMRAHRSTGDRSVVREGSLVTAMDATGVGGNILVAGAVGPLGVAGPLGRSALGMLQVDTGQLAVLRLASK